MTKCIIISTSSGYTCSIGLCITYTVCDTEVCINVGHFVIVIVMCLSDVIY